MSFGAAGGSSWCWGGTSHGGTGADAAINVEKETDVNLAVDMVIGAYENRFDVAMLVAGDTDYVRAVRAVQSRGKRVTWCHLPAQKHTDQLAQICDVQCELDEKFLRTCALGRRAD